MTESAVIPVRNFRSSLRFLMTLLVGVLLTTFLFLSVREDLLRGYHEKARADVSVRSRLIETRIEETLMIGRAAQEFVRLRSESGPSGLGEFFRSFLEREKGLDSMVWAPLRSAKRDSETFPIQVAETQNGEWLPPLGFDLASVPAHRAAIHKVSATGLPSASSLSRWGGKNHPAEVAVFFPVMSRQKAPATGIRGVIVLFFQPGKFVQNALSATAPLGLPFELRDQQASEPDSVLVKWMARLNVSGRFSDILYSSPKTYSRNFRFADRQWSLHAIPNAAYQRQNHPDAHWFVLVIGLLLTALAIWALKYQDSLRRSEIKYRIVSENTYDWEYWADPKGNMIYSSPSSFRITGRDHRQFMKDPGLLDQIIHPEDRALWDDHRIKASQGQCGTGMEFRIVRPDGTFRWVEHTCQPVQSEHWGWLGSRGSNRDVTERKESQAKVKKLEGLLPICASCKKIRDEKGTWQPVESYIDARTEAKFSHGLCPDCIPLYR